MMKFTEIMEAIKALNTEVQEAENAQKAETERYFATFEGLNIKERIAQKKENPEAETEHLQRIAETQETITNGKLKLKDGDGNFVGTGLTPDELKTFLGL